MADFIKNIIPGGKPADTPDAGGSDFADFAGAAAPEAPAAGATFGDAAASIDRPYTKWYNIHERHSLSEFKAEGMILAIVAVIFTVHVIGTRLNKSKAKAWVKANGPVLASEFAQAGFAPGVDAEKEPEKAMREKSLFEYASYATGRANVAFVDIKLTLKKRFNPFVAGIENVFGFFFEGMGGVDDIFEATLYPFDGKEDKIIPTVPGGAEIRAKDSKSAYDGFVWAVVHKDKMKQLRDDRYDLSITFTKDHNKLPNWATVMSESAEITNTLMTDELAAAVKQAGDLLDFIMVTDQPTEKPQTLDQTTPRKRIVLQYRLPSSNKYDDLLPLFKYYLRMADQLAAQAHFRPEIMRKVKNVRDENIKQLLKAAEEEKAEERAMEREKAKKAKRDAELNALDAKAQKRYLEKEKEKEMRKASKKQTMRA